MTYYYLNDPIPPPSTPPPDDENEWMAWSLGYVADVMTDLARKQSTEIARQEAEIKSLRRILRETRERAAQAQRPEPIPADLLQLLLQLTHPDRHGNSAASTKATDWLLKQRRRRSA